MHGRTSKSVYIGAGLAVAGGLVAAGAAWSWPLSSAAEWTALAAWVTAAVAVGAGVLGAQQLGEARRLRRERAQPYVVAFMEHSAASAWFVDLVVRNFGATAAHDVSVRIDPAPRRHSRDGEEVWLPPTIPVLVPGQEWRAFWDSGERMKSDLPRRHEAVVAFNDSAGDALPVLRSTLDWDALEGTLTINIRGIHHAAKALENIDKTLSAWREGPGGGLAVVVRDGDAKDARKREHLADRRTKRDRAEADRAERDA